MFSPSAYSTMLVGLPTDLLQSEASRLTDCIKLVSKKSSLFTRLITKIQLIDLEIKRRTKINENT